MKFCGSIGFIKQEEIEAGIYGDVVAEKNYYGEVLQNFRKWKSSDKVNDDIVLTNKLSVIADSFMTENLGAMKYVVYLGQKWKIDSAEIEYPRIVLTLGGLYNEATN